MSEVEVSINLPPKQAGKLYMQHMKRGKRIKELTAALEQLKLMLRVGMPEYDGTDMLEVVEAALKGKPEYAFKPMMRTGEDYIARPFGEQPVQHYFDRFGQCVHCQQWREQTTGPYCTVNRA